uniref:Uncharacterized protein n=1 Tax=Echinococcus granulosus TaxID=6210 RepID=A0A068X515_ECHGR|nr:hypothetical protein EgrG_002053600 [Echinococcus granulosus]
MAYSEDDYSFTEASLAAGCAPPTRLRNYIITTMHTVPPYSTSPETNRLPLALRRVESKEVLTANVRYEVFSMFFIPGPFNLVLLSFPLQLFLSFQISASTTFLYLLGSLHANLLLIMLDAAFPHQPLIPPICLL